MVATPTELAILESNRLLSSLSAEVWIEEEEEIQ